MTAAASAVLFPARVAYAQALSQTPELIEGPFYPDRLPLDTDNDLILINDSLTPSVGQICWLSGRVTGPTGAPIRDAFVEIWQCDARGQYIHSRGHAKNIDANFQGYGRFVTGSSGEYVFRTIKPVPYSQYGLSRAPHIHVAVSRNGRRLLTTQAHVNGHEANERDVLLGMLDVDARRTVLVDFEPLAGSSIGELTGRFDIRLGHTAAERDDGTLRGGLGKPLGPGNFWDAVEAVKQGRRPPTPK
jgi:protocatechuate 3,4-dioxygenase beta subunit